MLVLAYEELEKKLERTLVGRMTIIITVVIIYEQLQFKWYLYKFNRTRPQILEDRLGVATSVINLSVIKLWMSGLANSENFLF